MRPKLCTQWAKFVQSQPQPATYPLWAKGGPPPQWTTARATLLYHWLRRLFAQDAEQHNRLSTMWLASAAESAISLDITLQDEAASRRP